MSRVKLPGLTIHEVLIGTGAIAERKSIVAVHYRSFLNCGDLIQDTRSSGLPYKIIMGHRYVIAGLERGIIGMRVGGKRELIISPHLAYGDKGIPDVIPANAVLRFEIELVEVINQPRRSDS